MPKPGFTNRFQFSTVKQLTPMFWNFRKKSETTAAKTNRSVANEAVTQLPLGYLKN